MTHPADCAKCLSGEHRCAIEGCTRRLSARDWCHTHYMRWKNTGSPTGTARKSPAQRFWAKVRVEGECWIWTAASTHGHGVFFDESGRQVYAHRWVYESMIAPIPDGLTIDHLCRRTLCVNPYHLEPVPDRVNWWRWYTPRTHCPQGHEITGANLIERRTRNGRECRTCENERQRRNHHRNKVSA